MGTFCSCEDHIRDQSLVRDTEDPLDEMIGKSGTRSGRVSPVQRQRTPLQDPWGSEFAPVIPKNTDVSPVLKQGELSNIVKSTKSTKTDESPDAALETNVTNGDESEMDEPE